MDIHNVYDYGNTDEAIINHIGAVIYEDGPHAQSNASPGSNRADHELSTEDHHDGPDFADLTSHLHDVDPLPEGFELGSNDAPVFRDESTPWHSAWASDILGSHPKANEPLAPTSQTDVNGGCDSEIDPRWVCEACEAHSSMNGISGWPDFSRDEDLLECSCMDLPTDNTSFVSPSSSAQLVSVVLPQSLSPTTSMSRQDTQAGVAAVGASAIDESSASSYTRPARSAGRKDSLHDDKPGQSFASDEAAAQVSASPTNSASAARPHLCSDCGAGFKTRAGVAHHEKLHDPIKQNAQRCPECGHGCQHPKDMRRHRKTHLPAREKHQYPCPKASCPLSFTRKDNAMRHARREHTPQEYE